MSILNLHHSADRTILPIKVSAASNSNRIQGLFNGRLKINVVAAPEKGRANKAVIAFLSKKLQIPKQHMAIVSGGTHNEKRLAIDCLAAEELVVRLQRLLEIPENQVTQGDG